jgi:uncharacterized protein (TIGR02598 family)
MTFPPLRRCPGRRGSSRWREGGLNSFSLVEVVIAIAVTSFALISIVGLMAYAAQTLQQSDKYTRLSSVASQVLAVLSSEPFKLSQSQARTNYTLYYTLGGLPTNSASAYYQCSITNATPSGSPLQTWLEPIQVSIRWQKSGASGRFINTNIIVTSILNYD